MEKLGLIVCLLSASALVYINVRDRNELYREGEMMAGAEARDNRAERERRAGKKEAARQERWLAG